MQLPIVPLTQGERVDDDSSGGGGGGAEDCGEAAAVKPPTGPGGEPASADEPRREVRVPDDEDASGA
jgi:hypothetical protein